MVAPSAPDRGDVVWLAFNPQAGHEQAGRRPAVVLSPAAYNAKVGLALFCPITTKVKGYPFEVALPADFPVRGVILADQVRSLDWQARGAEFIARLPDEVTEEVLQKIMVLLT
jgi:mRNA interferase MazF